MNLFNYVLYNNLEFSKAYYMYLFNGFKKVQGKCVN